MPFSSLRSLMLCLALALGWAALGSAQPAGAYAAEGGTPATAPGGTNSSPNVQEELRMTQQVLEQLRRELDQNAARNAAAITSSLSMLEPTLARLQAQQMQLVQRSNSTILIVAGVFAGVGFLALLLIVVILMRALSRFSELATASNGPAARALLPAGSPATAALGSGELAHLNATAVEQASTRFQSAIDQLQKRIHELEHTTQPATPDAARTLPSPAAALNISPLPGQAKPGEASDTPARIGLLLGKGQALLNLDQADHALECFEEILTIDPNHTETLIRRGLALEKLQQWDKALESYDRAIALDNSLTVAFLYKGGVCNKLQRHREALESYEKALHTEKRSRAS
jgi:tetratricopeptide (TPR) repeat protein